MKGIGMWILIIGALLLGIAVFTIATKAIITYTSTINKQMTLEKINNLYNELKRICLTEGIGSHYYYEIALPENIKAVYVTKYEDELPPDEVTLLITQGKSSEGNYFCFISWNDNYPKCVKLQCKLNFTYIGTPSLKTDIFSILSKIGKEEPLYKYKLYIEKKEENYLLVKAKKEFK